MTTPSSTPPADGTNIHNNNPIVENSQNVKGDADGKPGYRDADPLGGRDNHNRDNRDHLTNPDEADRYNQDDDERLDGSAAGNPDIISLGEQAETTSSTERPADQGRAEHAQNTHVGEARDEQQPVTREEQPANGSAQPDTLSSTENPDYASDGRAHVDPADDQVAQERTADTHITGNNAETLDSVADAPSPDKQL